VIAARRLQRSFADGLITEEVKDLWEPWIQHADEALNDDQLLEIIQKELGKRCKKEVKRAAAFGSSFRTKQRERKKKGPQSSGLKKA
jgi:hypothetical protein